LQLISLGFSFAQRLQVKLQFSIFVYLKKETPLDEPAFGYLGAHPMIVAGSVQTLMSLKRLF
jgi:hypothetical protein